MKIKTLSLLLFITFSNQIFCQEFGKLINATKMNVSFKVYDIENKQIMLPKNVKNTITIPNQDFSRIKEIEIIYTKNNKPVSEKISICRLWFLFWQGWQQLPLQDAIKQGYKNIYIERVVYKPGGKEFSLICVK